MLRDSHVRIMALETVNKMNKMNAILPEFDLVVERLLMNAVIQGEGGPPLVRRTQGEGGPPLVRWIQKGHDV